MREVIELACPLTNDKSYRVYIDNCPGVKWGIPDNSMLASRGAYYDDMHPLGSVAAACEGAIEFESRVRSRIKSIMRDC